MLGLNGYPKIDVEYTWKLCNYNEENTTIKFSDNQISYFELKNKDTNITRQDFNSSTPDLVSGNCTELIQERALDTKYSHHYMSAQLSSPPYVNGVRPTDSNCYAYAYNPIEVTYGKCNVTVCIIRLSCNTNIFSAFANISNLTLCITD